MWIVEYNNKKRFFHTNEQAVEFAEILAKEGVDCLIYKSLRPINLK